MLPKNKIGLLVYISGLLTDGQEVAKRKKSVAHILQ